MIKLAIEYLKNFEDIYRPNGDKLKFDRKALYVFEKYGYIKLDSQDCKEIFINLTPNEIVDVNQLIKSRSKEDNEKHNYEMVLLKDGIQYPSHLINKGFEFYPGHIEMVSKRITEDVLVLDPFCGINKNVFGKYAGDFCAAAIQVVKELRPGIYVFKEEQTNHQKIEIQHILQIFQNYSPHSSNYFKNYFKDFYHLEIIINEKSFFIRRHGIFAGGISF